MHVRQEAAPHLSDEPATSSARSNLSACRAEYKDEIQQQFARHGVEVLATYTSPISAWPSRQTWPDEIEHDNELMRSTLRFTP